MELEVIIGLEIHAQLNTQSKLFSSSDNSTFGAEPNARINEIDMGFPGTLPVLNQLALEKSIRAASALGGEIQEFSKFDRKNYFYPDLPFGYQISQYDKPLSLNGQVDIEINENIKSVGITRVHIENDAGKLTHTDTATLCDYNRSGAPLIEIVTEPDLRSPEEAQMLAKEIQKILRYTNASDADMEKGMMRFDASISLRPKGDLKLYPRAEIKNLNSFTALFKALTYEYGQQKQAWEAGTPREKEQTLGWDDATSKTKILRDKESAHDYRYFPEPDLPPIVLTQKEIKNLSFSEELPLAKYKRYQSELGLSAQEALKLTETKSLADFFETVAKDSKTPKKAAHLILSVLLADSDWQKTVMTTDKMTDILMLLSRGSLSATGAKDLVLAGMESDKSAQELMDELGLEQVSDTDSLEIWVEEVLAENPEAVAAVKTAPDEDRKSRLLGPLIGNIMKKSNGSANPKMVRELLLKKIN